MEQVIKLGPGHSGLLLDFVAVLIKEGYVKDADKILQIAKPPKETAKYLHTLARIREAQGRLDDASALIRKALALEPKSFDILFDAARFSGQHNRWQEALDYLQRCDDVAPDRPEVLLKLTLALLKTKRREKAVSVARRMATVAPNDPNANYLLAFTLVETELGETAEPIARKALQQNPKDPSTHLLMGIIYYTKGDLERARESFNECLALDPNLADGHY